MIPRLSQGSFLHFYQEGTIMLTIMEIISTFTGKSGAWSRCILLPIAYSWLGLQGGARMCLEILNCASHWEKKFSYKDSMSHSSDQSNFMRRSQTDLLWVKWQQHGQTGNRELHLLQVLLKQVAALLTVGKGLSFCWKLVFLAMPSIIILLKKQEDTGT